MPPKAKVATRPTKVSAVRKTVYTKLDPREAVLNAPEMYAGCMEREKRKEYHYVKIDDVKSNCSPGD